MRRSLPLEGLLVHRRATVSVLLATLVAMAWGYLVVMVADHGNPAAFGPGMGLLADSPALARLADLCVTAVESFGMPAHDGPWGAADLALVLAMWLVMCVAMMLPTAAPMVLTFADVTSTRLAGRALLGRVAVFAGAYLAVWGAFSVAATLLQWALHGAALMTPGMVSASPWLSGGLLILAGLYQFTPIKDLCLTACRNPMTWFMGHWRSGTAGAWHMGLRHGLFCLGCCWALMLLMFFAGVMNLVWVALLAALMLAEKVLPKGDLAGKAVGIGLMGWGLALLSTA